MGLGLSYYLTTPGRSELGVVFGDGEQVGLSTCQFGAAKAALLPSADLP